MKNDNAITPLKSKFSNDMFPSMASAGIVVINVMGKTKVNINLMFNGYALEGNLPAVKNALNTSDVLNVCTNHILVVAVINQSEYKINTPNVKVNIKINGFQNNILLTALVAANIARNRPTIISGIPPGVKVLVDKQN